METTGCSEMPVSNYHCTLRNFLEERRSHLNTMIYEIGKTVPSYRQSE
jgi:hypothetical protein